MAGRSAAKPVMNELQVRTGCDSQDGSIKDRKVRMAALGQLTEYAFDANVRFVEIDLHFRIRSKVPLSALIGPAQIQ